MCSIIGLKIKKDIDTIEEENNLSRFIKMVLFDKGGDDFGAIFHLGNEIYRCNTLDEIIQKIEDPQYMYSEGDAIFAFSRLTPEMENTNGRIPPYKTIFGKYVAAHGTIPLKDIDIPMIDTEMLKFENSIESSLNKVEELNGKISIVEYDPESRTFYGTHNGLGIVNIYSEYFNGITNMLLDSKICDDDGFIKNYGFFEVEPNFVSTIDETEGNYKLIEIDKDSEIFVSLCSGGMDAVLSTTNILIENVFNYSVRTTPTIHIDYFNWGTNAASKEIEACKKFIEEIKKLINEDEQYIDVIFDEIPAKDYFKEILNFTGEFETRLTSMNASGLGENEAEEAISYVPLRNTFLIMALVAKYEKIYPNKKVTIIFGGNLTEGMVYSDNSVNYIEKLNQLVKVAGQKTSKFQVVAPYSKFTKTKMISDFKSKYPNDLLRNLLDLSFSCYFPEEGKPCGKCGSCNLRETAIQRSTLPTIPKNVQNKE